MRGERITQNKMPRRDGFPASFSNATLAFGKERMKKLEYPMAKFFEATLELSIVECEDAAICEDDLGNAETLRALIPALVALIAAAEKGDNDALVLAADVLRSSWLIATAEEGSVN